MGEYHGLEISCRLGEQPLVLNVCERREEVPRPFARLPSKRFAACPQDEPVAALAAFSSRLVYFRQQIPWNMECRRRHK